MKKLIITSILALLITGASAMRAQDWPDEYLGLPGDNLNLYAVMNLFQESETLEGFERELNAEDSRINNLDLNGDNMVDYITVTDYVDGDVHTIVLRAMLSRNESQDVAVFTVEQLRNGEVQIQLIGDEALYGRDYIIEPIYAETPNPGYRGTSGNVTVVTTTYHDVSVWPVVVYMYHPTYVVWRSSWYWGYYPVYWNPWHTYYWHYYYGYHYNYYPHYYAHYHYCDHYRYTRYNDFYYTHIRTYSPVVSERIRGGHYKSTYSRPEQRKDGEALYASVNSTQNTRTHIRTATNNQEGRTDARPAQNTNTAVHGTVNARRTTESTTNRAGTSTPMEHRTTTTNRTTTTATNRSIATPSATRSTATTQRSTNSATARTAESSNRTQNTATARRSTTTANPSVNRSTATTRSSSSASATRNSSRSSSR